MPRKRVSKSEKEKFEKEEDKVEDEIYSPRSKG
jgi:hypothetical protein